MSKVKKETTANSKNNTLKKIDMNKCFEIYQYDKECTLVRTHGEIQGYMIKLKNQSPTMYLLCKKMRKKS